MSSSFGIGVGGALLAIASMAQGQDLDQQFDPGAAAEIVATANTVNTKAAQTFEVGADGVLSSVEVLVSKGFSGAPLRLEICPVDSGGNPLDGTVLASGSVSSFAVTAQPGWVSFPLQDAELSVFPGQRLAVVLSAPSATSAGTYRWWGSSAGGYPRGVAFERNIFAPGQPWVTLAPADVGFRTFVAGCEAPEPYCVSQLSSSGCLPAIGGYGVPDGVSSFDIVCTEVDPGLNGILFWGLGEASIPLLGGTRCVASPIQRTAVQSSTVCPSSGACSGAFSMDFSPIIAQQSIPTGTPLFAQYWSRDPGSSGGSNLSNALRFRVGCGSPPTSSRNLAWTADPSFDPAPADMIGIEFGVNDEVDILQSGSLPLVISTSIQNTGGEVVTGGYGIEVTVTHWVFQAVAGAAAYVPGDPGQATYFDCVQCGPTLQPGEVRPISFTLGGSDCPLQSPPGSSGVLDCGLYEVVITADSTSIVPEGNEIDNQARRFFFVQGNSVVSISENRNPFMDPAVTNHGPYERVWAPAGSFGHATHGVTVQVFPSGTAFVNAVEPVISAFAGDMGAWFPVIPTGPIVLPPGGNTYNYWVTPNADYCHPAGPNIFWPPWVPLENANTCVECTGPGGPGGWYHAEECSSKITVISGDGCSIAQLKVQVGVDHCWQEGG